MDNIRVENIRGYMNTPQGGEGIWQANETVEVGDMRTLSGRDNTGYMLEYVGAGVTGDTQPIVPSLTEVANYSAVDRVGKMRMIFNLADKDVDEILAAGVLYNRATYSELWNYVQLKPSLLISEAEWQAKYVQTNGKFVPYYSEGDGTTTFRTPLLSAYPCGVNNVEDIGVYKEDTFKAHHHQIMSSTGNTDAQMDMEGNATGFAGFSNGSRGYADSTPNMNGLSFVEDTGDEETRPKTMYGIWVIKAVGVIVDSIGNTDIQGILNGVQQLQNQIAVLQNQVSDTNNFTIIYPNGGTAESPANVAIATRYEEDNPFQGYYITCEAQLLYNEKWNTVGWLGLSANYKYGVRATQLLPDDKIIVQTAKDYLLCNAQSMGHGLGEFGDISTPLPCRVLVYKLGKIESGV